MEQITVRNIPIEIVRKDIKHMHLRVYPPSGMVRISAPHSVTQDAVRLFAVQRIHWIQKQQREFLLQERMSPREYLERESHYYKGERYLLQLVEQEASPRVEIKNKTYLCIFIRPKTPIQKIEEILNQWYRGELKEIIPAYIEKWEGKLGVKVEEWYVKKMRTKWGTCNPEKRRIWLNLELAKKPERCLEYIIVHEMVHFLVKTHNEQFIELMNQYLPNWKALRRELNSLPVSHAEWRY